MPLIENEGCSRTPDVNGTWCYVARAINAARECETAKESDFANETRKWRKCDPNEAAQLRCDQREKRKGYARSAGNATKAANPNATAAAIAKAARDAEFHLAKIQGFDMNEINRSHSLASNDGDKQTATAQQEKEERQEE